MIWRRASCACVIINVIGRIRFSAVKLRAVTVVTLLIYGATAPADLWRERVGIWYDAPAPVRHGVDRTVERFLVARAWVRDRDCVIERLEPGDVDTERKVAVAQRLEVGKRAARITEHRAGDVGVVARDERPAINGGGGGSRSTVTTAWPCWHWASNRHEQQRRQHGQAQQHHRWPASEFCRAWTTCGCCAARESRQRAATPRRRAGAAGCAAAGRAAAKSMHEVHFGALSQICRSNLTCCTSSAAQAKAAWLS